jgi:hypothetical protein
MSATLAVDILVGAFQLSPTQQRVLRESQGYVRGGTKVNAATRRVLVRLGLIESSGRGHTTTAWGDAIGEELVARQAAQGEYLPEILWKDSKGWLDGDRFQLVIHGPQSYALDDTQGRVGQVLKTLVHAQQLVREILAEEAREADAAHEEAYGDGFDQLAVDEVLDDHDSTQLRPGDLITMIGTEVLDPPIEVAEFAGAIYGHSGPVGVRLKGPSRATVTYLYCAQYPKVSIRRPAGTTLTEPLVGVRARA